METRRKLVGTPKMDKMVTGVVRAVVLAVHHYNLSMKKRNWTTAGIVPVANQRESVGERPRALHRTRIGEAAVQEWPTMEIAAQPTTRTVVDGMEAAMEQGPDPKTNVLLG
jgi:hypothetical protein